MPVDPTRRPELERRREALRQQLALRQRDAAVAYECGVLDRAGTPYALDYEDALLWRWVEDTFPMSRTGIDWAALPGHRHSADPAGALLALHVAGTDPPVEVVYENGLCPAIRLALSAFLPHADALASGTTWVLCRAQGWVLEYESWAGWRGAAAPR